MKIVEDVRGTSETFRNVTLTLGSFDGVHLGHQAIIRRVVDAARASNGPAAVMALRPHPQAYFRPDSPPHLLTSDRTRERLFAELGVDALFYLPFDAATAALDRREFLDTILLERCGGRHFVIGYDLRFGQRAEGDFAYLETMSRERPFTVERVDPVLLDGRRVSSTAIRQALAAGDLDGAEAMLGRPYRLTGRVTAGRGLGRELGFPTANVAPDHTAFPADGIYAAEAWIRGRRYGAAVNVGYAPTLAHAERTVEAHLLDFSGDLHGEPIEIDFRKRIRGEKKFESLPELVAAIGADVREIRGVLAAD